MGRKSRAVYSVKNDLKSKKMSAGKQAFYKDCNKRAENTAIARRVAGMQPIAK